MVSVVTIPPPLFSVGALLPGLYLPGFDIRLNVTRVEHNPPGAYPNIREFPHKPVD
jgi:hypothetical protein